MAEHLERAQLIELAEVILHPKGTGFSSQEITQKLLFFCANCPDPVGSMRLIVECTTPMSTEALVDTALAMPPRSPKNLPASELPLGHPLRKILVDPEQE